MGYSYEAGRPDRHVWCEFWRRWSLLGLFSLGPATVIGATAAYKLSIFGPAAGRYSASYGSGLWQGLAGLLFSPSRGLFLYTLVFLFGACVWRNRPQTATPVCLVSSLSAISQVLLISKWHIWGRGRDAAVDWEASSPIVGLGRQSYLSWCLFWATSGARSRAFQENPRFVLGQVSLTVCWR
jgi:hypothetical protein